MKKIVSWIAFCLFAAGNGLQANVDLLKKQDVNHIMQEIFKQHVDKKAMTPEILKHSFRVYIDQFDPERIYLLESEVAPFEEIEGIDLEKAFENYSKGDFSVFERLDGVIQNAIYRARKMREKIEQNKKKLFDHNSSQAGDYGKWSDPDLKLPFVKTLPELEERIADHLIHFIDAEKKRFGDKKVMDYQPQTLSIYNKYLENFENHYLYQDDLNKPLPPLQKENLFSFHLLKALAGSLDAHTTVLNPAEAYDMRVRLEKGFQGVGIGFKQSENKALQVTSLVEGGPAEKSGKVEIGDRLVDVNGKNVENAPIDDVMKLLRNTSGASVKLVFKRGNKTIPVELQRESIAVVEDRVEMSYVPYQNGVIGKITLHSFYQGSKGVSSQNDVEKAINNLRKIGPIKGLILDLRENSGGFLMQAVKVAGLFITNGVIVVSKYANGERHYYRDVNNGVSYDGPLVILTSKATASAAEIVAQALQDYGVALVVGDEHTYGKGTIQSQTVTDDKSTSYFKVTVGEYYTVSGKTPQIQGVKADIVVPSPFVDEHIGEEYLDYALNADTIAPSFDDTLNDVDAEQKSWYLHYYMPTLQKRSEKWREILPVLRINESKRLESNELYKKFMVTQKNNDAEAIEVRKKYWQEDVQMQEAVNIIKDMIASQPDSK